MCGGQHRNLNISMVRVGVRIGFGVWVRVRGVVLAMSGPIAFLRRRS